jgi:hypothetical protein
MRKEIIYYRINTDETLTISATPLPGAGDKCMVIRLQGNKDLLGTNQLKRYITYIELCEDTNNKLFIKRDVSAEEGASLFRKSLGEMKPPI